MHATSLAIATGSSVLSAATVWLAWFWYLPILRQLTQKGIDSPLSRLGEVGFHESKIRSRLFALELGLAVTLAYLAAGTISLYLAAALAFIYFHARSLVLAHVIDRRERKLRAQTLSLTVALQGLTQSGLSLPQAVLHAAPETAAPLGNQIQKLAKEYRLGRPMHEAIDYVRQTLRLDAFSLLVTAINCSLKQGTPLRDALLGVQETLEHRDRVERQLLAQTASARTTIKILSASPFFFMGAFAIFMPKSVGMLFQTSDGHFLLSIILVTFYSGVAWSQSLLRIR